MFLRGTRAVGQGCHLGTSRGNRRLSGSPRASSRRPSSSSGILHRQDPQSLALLAPLGRASPLPDPPPIVEGPLGLLLHWWFSVPGVLLRSSSFGSQVLASLASQGGGTGSLALPLLENWAPLVGRQLKLPILVPHRCVLWPRP